MDDCDDDGIIRYNIDVDVIQMTVTNNDANAGSMQMFVNEDVSYDVLISIQQR